MESLEEKKKEDERRKALHAAREKQEQEKIREEQRTHAQQVKDNAKKVTIIQLFETIKEARKLAAELDPDTAATTLKEAQAAFLDNPESIAHLP